MCVWVNVVRGSISIGRDMYLLILVNRILRIQYTFDYIVMNHHTIAEGCSPSPPLK